MSRLNRRIKAAIPNSVRRALAHTLRPFGVPPRLQSLLAFDGFFSLRLDGRLVHFEYANRWIERDLFWHGWKGYEPVSLDLWRRCAKNARTIVDIGANTGLFAIVAKATNKKSVVLAFEPLPMFADVLKRNAAHNGLDIRLVRAAVSSTEGRAEFFVPEELAGNIYSSSLSREHYDRHQQSAARVFDVQVLSFDAYAANHDIRHVDLVKIDAEGHDVMVLQGMAGILARDTPDCLIEIQSDEEGEKMMPFFDPARYAYYNLSETAGPQRAERLRRSETVNFFVCKHETAGLLSLR